MFVVEAVEGGGAKVLSHPVLGQWLIYSHNKVLKKQFRKDSEED